MVEKTSLAKQTTGRVLVVEDDDVTSMLLKHLLRRAGFQVTRARSTGEALTIFDADQPDLVLMDIQLHNSDGFDATRRIKARVADGQFIPVVFLTGTPDPADLGRCMAAGGDDFLTKPYDSGALLAKIESMLRLRALHDEVQQQSASLALFRSRQQREFEVAERLFANVVHPGCLANSDVRYEHDAMSVFNGDLLLAAHMPTRDMRILVGDFTGHGLSAAIGAMPVADIFYGMTAKGFSMGNLLTEINRKLRKVLPVGRFFAAAVIDLDASGTRLKIWNGGLPDVLVFRPGAGIRHRLTSRNLPLGALETQTIETGTEFIDVAVGDRLLAYSDGILEALNPQGQMFGTPRLEAALNALPAGGSGFEAIRSAVEAFRAGGEQTDDVTLIEVPCHAASAPYDDTRTTLDRRPSMAWEVGLELGADALKAIDPLPQLWHLLHEYQDLGSHWEAIYTILAELFSNALEHGLLRLDSTMKASPAGFADYYAQRRERLASLRSGYVRIKVGNSPTTTGGGELHIRFEDSGPGFAHQCRPAGHNHTTALHGRGLVLVSKLADDLTHLGRGNIAEATYCWS